MDYRKKSLWTRTDEQLLLDKFICPNAQDKQNNSQSPLQGAFFNASFAFLTKKIVRVHHHYVFLDKWLRCMRPCTHIPNPWIWRENQREAVIGFPYSEIRFLNKYIVKYLKINAIFSQSIYFFQFFFVLEHYR